MKKLLNYLKLKKRKKEIISNFITCVTKTINNRYDFSKYNRIKIYDNKPIVTFNEKNIKILCNIPNTKDGLRYIHELKKEQYNIFKIFQNPIQFVVCDDVSCNVFKNIKLLNISKLPNIDDNKNYIITFNYKIKNLVKKEKWTITKKDSQEKVTFAEFLNDIQYKDETDI